MGKRIFINYRRDDTQAEALLLNDFLNRYDVEKVFYDLSTIRHGEPFDVKIKSVLRNETDVVLSLIGKQWETEVQNRIGKPGKDFVILEIDTAINLGIRVIPLLFYRGALNHDVLSTFPWANIQDELPKLNAVPIRADILMEDYKRLAENTLGLTLKPTPKQDDSTHLHQQIANLNQQLKEAHANYQALQARYNEKDQLLSQAKQTIASLEAQLLQAHKTAVQTTPAPSISNEFIEMVYVEGGTFQMGSNDGEDREKLVHEVTLSSYYIVKYPVTQKQWEKIMGENNNPSEFKGGNRPVEKISWNDAVQFIKLLSLETNQNYRLPTEAEWEFAARGGNKSKGFLYSGSNNLDEVGWFADNSRNETKEVGKKKPNELGIYDMSGNVWEWCKDSYGAYPAEKQIDPPGAAIGAFHVNRGGSWDFDAQYCRVAYRYSDAPGSRTSSLGFRLVLVP